MPIERSRQAHLPPTERRPLSAYIHTIRLYSQPAGFEWDDTQSRRCHDAYGFSFHELVPVFNDEEHDYLRAGPYDFDGEAQYRAVGRTEWGLIVTVVYTMREAGRRIVWARPASRAERRAFHAQNGLTDER
jgi:uncharacterized DUF497 family protein